MKTLLAALTALMASTTASTTLTVPPPAGSSYRFDEVKRTVTLRSGAGEKAATKGLPANGGDKVHTGWFSYARIASEQHHAKFEIFASTDVQLASGGTPGVILSLERGRLHAIFDKITGSEPRIVQTPGALLAVRGTQYTVSVDDAGRTQLDVWEGTVEVTSPLRREPLFVHAGESSIFSRREAPPDRPTKTPPERGRDGENHPRAPQGQDPRSGEDHHGRTPGDGGTHPPSPGSGAPPPHGGMTPPPPQPRGH